MDTSQFFPMDITSTGQPLGGLQTESPTQQNGQSNNMFAGNGGLFMGVSSQSGTALP